MLEYHIRPMVQSDIPACLAIASECWNRLTAQSAQPDFEAMFSSAPWKPFFYVAEDSSEVVGMAGWGVSGLSYGIYNLFWHGVRQRARRQGIGEGLVRRRLVDLEPIADVIMLATTIPNYYAEHFGFRTISKIKTTENYGDYLMILDVQHDHNI